MLCCVCVVGHKFVCMIGSNNFICLRLCSLPKQAIVVVAVAVAAAASACAQSRHSYAPTTAQTLWQPAAACCSCSSCWPRETPPSSPVGSPLGQLLLLLLLLLGACVSFAPSIHVKIAINLPQFTTLERGVGRGSAVWHVRDLLFIAIATKRCKIMRKSPQLDSFMFSFPKFVCILCQREIEIEKETEIQHKLPPSNPRRHYAASPASSCLCCGTCASFVQLEAAC